MGFLNKSKADSHLEEAKASVENAIEEIQKAMKSEDFHEFKESYVEGLEDILVKLFAIKRKLL